MKIKINQSKSHFIILNLIVSLIYLQIVEPILNTDLLLIADDQTCSDQLDLAEENYYEGKLDETIELIMQCLKNKSVDNTVKVRAYTILLRTFLAKDNIESAKEIIHKILIVDGNYQPSLEQERPRLVNLVAEVKKEHEKNQEKENISDKQTESGINKWLWIGAGGVVVAGVIAVIASSGSDTSEEQKKDLPAPPAFP